VKMLERTQRDSRCVGLGPRAPMCDVVPSRYNKMSAVQQIAVEVLHKKLCELEGRSVERIPPSLTHLRPSKM